MSTEGAPAPARNNATHPAQAPTLFIYMGLCLALGTAAFCLNEALGMVFASLIAGIFYACFLILFAVYWLAWMLRGHTIWRDR